MVYPTAHADHTGDSKQQPYSSCSCQSGTKQLTDLGVGIATYADTALNCHVCNRRGGSWPRVLHDLCDAEQLFELYAVEAHSLTKPEHTIKYAGLILCTVSKPWDTIVAAHGGLATRMHGQGQNVILLVNANNCNTSFAENSLKDQCMLSRPGGRVGVCCGGGWLRASATRAALAGLCKRSKAVRRQ